MLDYIHCFFDKHVWIYMTMFANTTQFKGVSMILKNLAIIGTRTGRKLEIPLTEVNTVSMRFTTFAT